MNHLEAESHKEQLELPDRTQEPINVSQFYELSSAELRRILGLTIKMDDDNKLIAFLCQLSAYTEGSQFNVIFNAPSSSGKSYIPLEVSDLFPSEDVMKLGNCSPNAFFHEQGIEDKKTNTITVDLSRIIIIFLDQPNPKLLERLRSLLSHDEKLMISKITDKNQSGGNRTKTVVIKGYPAVIFCTVSSHLDEQESTRFLLLSPETSSEKVRQGIAHKVFKEADSGAYREQLNSNEERNLLKLRIEAIKREGITDINIPHPDQIIDRFLVDRTELKPRHQRDIGRLMNLIKSFALVNLWWRDRDGSVIVANQSDIDDAFALWDTLSISQELNLPPYVHGIYKEVILPLWELALSKADTLSPPLGLTKLEIMGAYHSAYGRPVADWNLRQQILPPLVLAGLIIEERHPTDGRISLYRPTGLNSESDGGVNNSS